MVRISDAIAFAFRGEHAWPTIAFLLICMLIPIVGPMVCMGYISGVEKLLVSNIRSDATRFDFGKFSFYASRGVVPFFSSMLVAMIIVLPLMIVMGVPTIVAIVFLQDHPGYFFAVILATTATMTAASLLLSVPMTSVVFRAAVEQSFSSAFRRDFILDFARRVGGQIIWTNIKSWALSCSRFPSSAFPLHPTG